MIDESAVRAMVRRVVLRAIGRSESRVASRSRFLVTERDLQGVEPGGELVLAPGALVTPLARQAAMERRIRLAEAPPETASAVRGAEAAAGPADRETVALGADHGGFELKERIRRQLEEEGYGVLDCGTHGPESVDYPDFALAVARLVAEGKAFRGILVDGAGIGSCMAANKVPGVRAALCYDEATAVNSREHNDANVLTLGAGFTGADQARRIVRTWLATPAGGGRHARRVSKIMDIERRYLAGR
ncbi:MAG: ribose 5-phosphate isomerase B [Gemmatimonadota bacterium]